MLETVNIFVTVFGFANILCFSNKGKTNYLKILN